MARTDRALPCIVVAAYVFLTVMTVLAYHSDDSLQWPFLVWIGLSVLGTWLVDRGWFALMPVLAILFAAPLGYPESEFEPLPTVYITTYAALIALAGCLAVVFVRARGRDD